jgi:hypothetical protein
MHTECQSANLKRTRRDHYGDPGHPGGDDIKIDFRQTLREGVDWTRPARRRV